MALDPSANAAGSMPVRLFESTVIELRSTEIRLPQVAAVERAAPQIGAAQ